MLPAQYRWLEAEPGPRMILEALKQYGTLEAPGDADNPKIVGWQEELEAAGLGRVYAGVYRHDAIPWCGLFMAIVAHRANIERRPERNPPRLYLSALEWASFGTSVPKGAAALGDVLVFKRKGGGHVGLYVGHDASPSTFSAAINPIASRSPGCRATGSWRCAARPIAPSPRTSARSLSLRAEASPSTRPDPTQPRRFP
jgi:uncharacterized protein (TIGR02594 family)